MLRLEQQTKTQETLLLEELINSAKKDLQSLSQSRKDRIRRLAAEIDSYGIIPTDMICSLLCSKLSRFVSSKYLNDALESKYKNPNKVKVEVQHNNSVATMTEAKINNNNKAKENREHNNSVIAPTVMEYPSHYDVSNCEIGYWEYYPDWLKKKWTESLIEERHSLTLEILGLQRQIAQITNK